MVVSENTLWDGDDLLELHRIGEEKLKVMLTPFDMMKYGLTAETLDYENTETRKAIWNILDHAKHETGFDGARGRICIEVFPEKNGGCAIYITRISEEKEEKMKSPEQKERLSVFSFEKAENMLRVCRCLFSRGYKKESHAYYENAERKTSYFLALREEAPSPKEKTKAPREHLFILEFGKRLEGEHMYSYLSEHCTPICTENAVKTLAPLADRSK